MLDGIKSYRRRMLQSSYVSNILLKVCRHTGSIARTGRFGVCSRARAPHNAEMPAIDEANSVLETMKTVANQE